MRPPPRHRRRAAAGVAAALLALLGSAYAPLSTAATEVGPVRMADDRPVAGGGTLTVALKPDPDKLDPSPGSTLVGRSAFASMCEKLHDTDAHSRYVPDSPPECPR